MQKLSNMNLAERGQVDLSKICETLKGGIIMSAVKAKWTIFLSLILTLVICTGVMAGEWITDKKSKVKVWSPHPVITVEWAGGTKDGFADGKGTMKWFEDGVLSEKIEGTFVKGKAEGKCSFELYKQGKAAVTGTADFKDGKANGAGEVAWADGRKYKGDVKNGKENGHGVLTWKNGASFDGEFKDGVRDGKGTFTTADGTKYQGTFVNGMPHGQFTITHPDGKVENKTVENSLAK